MCDKCNVLESGKTLVASSIDTVLGLETDAVRGKLESAFADNFVFNINVDFDVALKMAELYGNTYHCSICRPFTRRFGTLVYFNADGQACSAMFGDPTDELNTTRELAALICNDMNNIANVSPLIRKDGCKQKKVNLLVTGYGQQKILGGFHHYYFQLPSIQAAVNTHEVYKEVKRVLRAMLDDSPKGWGSIYDGISLALSSLANDRHTSLVNANAIQFIKAIAEDIHDHRPLNIALTTSNICTRFLSGITDIKDMYYTVHHFRGSSFGKLVTALISGDPWQNAFDHYEYMTDPERFRIREKANADAASTAKLKEIFAAEKLENHFSCRPAELSDFNIAWTKAKSVEVNSTLNDLFAPAEKVLQSDVKDDIVDIGGIRNISLRTFIEKLLPVSSDIVLNISPDQQWLQYIKPISTDGVGALITWNKVGDESTYVYPSVNVKTPYNINRQYGATLSVDAICLPTPEVDLLRIQFLFKPTIAYTTQFPDVSAVLVKEYYKYRADITNIVSYIKPIQAEAGQGVVGINATSDMEFKVIAIVGNERRHYHISAELQSEI